MAASRSFGKSGDVTQAAARSAPQGAQWERLWCQEKPRSYASSYPYRKPTQVGGHKCAKEYERTLVQELGNTTAVTSG